MKQVQLHVFREVKKLPRDDIYIDLTIYGIPSILVHEFVQEIVKPLYPGGISEAIKDLMFKAVQSEKSTWKPFELTR